MFACKSCGLVLPEGQYRVHKRGYRIGKCKECERAYQREWSARTPDEYRRRKRVSMAKTRAADPEAARAYQREYSAKNREHVRKKIRDYATRRFFWTKACKLRGESPAGFRELASLWRRQSGLCALTGRRLDRSAELDHKLPKARGGGDEVGNLQWVTREANRAKRDLTDAEFAALCSDVMRWIGRRLEAVDAMETAVRSAA
jgi:5-methylcytosine-specific restriction endonuclease McrA